MRWLFLAVAVAACAPTPIEWVHIPAGEGLIGLDVDGARPQQMVQFNEFWITKTQITRGQFEQCGQPCGDDEFGWRGTAANEMARQDSLDARHGVDGGRFDAATKGPINSPKMLVVPYEARSFAEFMDARLPTEAEWEYVARGGPLQVEWWMDGRRFPPYPTYKDPPPGCIWGDVSPQGVCNLVGGFGDIVADAWMEEGREAFWPGPVPEPPEEEYINIEGFYGVFKVGHLRRSNARALSDGDTEGTPAHRSKISQVNTLHGFRLVRDTPPPGWTAGP